MTGAVGPRRKGPWNNWMRSMNSINVPISSHTPAARPSGASNGPSAGPDKAMIAAPNAAIAAAIEPLQRTARVAALPTQKRPDRHHQKQRHGQRHESQDHRRADRPTPSAR